MNIKPITAIMLISCFSIGVALLVASLPEPKPEFHFSVSYETNRYDGWWDRNEIDNISGIPNNWHPPKTNITAVLTIQAGPNTFRVIK